MDKILVIADFEKESTIAINRAIDIAQSMNTCIHIVYFCHETLRHIDGDKGAVKQKVLAAQRLNAEIQLQDLDFSGVEHNYEVVWENNIPRWVDKYVSEQQPCLVLKTGHRSETLFYTPTDWQLLRECDAPLMIAAEDKWRRAPNVLAAVDLETGIEEKLQLNQIVLSKAKQMAQSQQSEVFVVYTVPFSPLLRDLGMQFTDELEIKAERELDEQVNQIAEQYDIPVENIIIKAGQVEKVIPSVAANNKAGVVVMGTVARKGITGKLMGNTAEKVLKLLKSDVVALKPQS